MQNWYKKVSRNFPGPADLMDHLDLSEQGP